MSKGTKKVAEKQANQYEIDPRQELYLSYFLDPKSETFSNAYQSAVKAKYSEEYAKNMASRLPKWLLENVNDGCLIRQAEKNLKEFLEMNTVNVVGEGEGAVVKDDPQLKRIKLDATKFSLERLHKLKYSAKTEVDQNNTGEVTIKIERFDSGNNSTT